MLQILQTRPKVKVSAAPVLLDLPPTFPSFLSRLFSTSMAVLGIPPLRSAMSVLQKELQDKARELNALKQQLQGPQGKDFSRSKRLLKDTFDTND